MRRILFLLAVSASPVLAQTPADTAIQPPASVASKESQVTADTPNPLGADADAVEAGHALFGRMNCAGCHGYDLTGGMGPDLTGTTRNYDVKPGEIYGVIANGTERGMPAWNDKLSPTEIWQLVAYINSKHAN